MCSVGCCRERRDDTKDTNKRGLSSEKKLALNLGLEHLGSLSVRLDRCGQKWGRVE